MNIALKVFWSNHPLPINQKIENPDIVLNIPFGNVLVIESTVKSVNSKIGDVILNASDVNADFAGSADQVKSQLELQINTVKNLAEINQLNLSEKVDIQDFEISKEHIELNRLTLLSKVDFTALAMLTALVNTKADQVYVQEQIAMILNSDQSMIAAIQEISSALNENEDLLSALDYTVANRVRFDIATQALTALQKSNARTNIDAEEMGTAAMLIAQITAQNIGAATVAQGLKANTALQSADVAPVALTGLFNSLNGQHKIFDVVHSAYAVGTNAAISATDTLGIMLAKLQAQINAKSSHEVVWVDIESVGFLNKVNYAYFEQPDGTLSKIEVARINGNLWVRGIFKCITNSPNSPIFTIKDKNYKIYVPSMQTSSLCFIECTRQNNSGLLEFKSSAIVYDDASAAEAVQICSPRTPLSASTNIPIHIVAVCIGKLAL